MSSSSEQQNLIAQVGTELADPEWSTRTHGSVGTYNSGCRGPLCQKANRDHQRAKYAARARRAGAVVDAHLKLRSERDHDTFLSLLQDQHLKTRLALLERKEPA